MSEFWETEDGDILLETNDGEIAECDACPCGDSTGSSRESDIVVRDCQAGCIGTYGTGYEGPVAGSNPRYDPLRWAHCNDCEASIHATLEILSWPDWIMPAPPSCPQMTPPGNYGYGLSQMVSPGSYRLTLEQFGWYDPDAFGPVYPRPEQWPGFGPTDRFCSPCAGACWSTQFQSNRENVPSASPGPCYPNPWRSNSSFPRIWYPPGTPYRAPWMSMDTFAGADGDCYGGDVRISVTLQRDPKPRRRVPSTLNRTGYLGDSYDNSNTSLPWVAVNVINIQIFQLQYGGWTAFQWRLHEFYEVAPASVMVQPEYGPINRGTNCVDGVYEITWEDSDDVKCCGPDRRIVPFCGSMSGSYVYQCVSAPIAVPNMLLKFGV